MNKLARLTPEQRDNLVAYLDGELDEAETQSIEHVMSRSTTVQHDVEMLTRTFEMLDFLPRPAAGEAFTNRTLASLEAIKTPPKLLNWAAIARPLRRALVLLVWGAALVLSVQIGFQLTHRWIPTQSDLLLDDLSVIQQWEMYRDAGDVEFLRELARKGTLQHD